MSAFQRELNLTPILRFRIDRSVRRTPNSVLVYRPEEYSFDMEPAPSRSFTSVLVDDLNLEIDEAGKVISVWGMCPHTRWVETTLARPEAERGDIVFVLDAPPYREFQWGWPTTNTCPFKLIEHRVGFGSKEEERRLRQSNRCRGLFSS